MKIKLIAITICSLIAGIVTANAAVSPIKVSNFDINNKTGIYKFCDNHNLIYLFYSGSARVAYGSNFMSVIKDGC